LIGLVRQRGRQVRPGNIAGVRRLSPGNTVAQVRQLDLADAPR